MIADDMTETQIEAYFAALVKRHALGQEIEAVNAKYDALADVENAPLIEEKDRLYQAVQAAEVPLGLHILKEQHGLLLGDIVTRDYVEFYVVEGAYSASTYYGLSVREAEFDPPTIRASYYKGLQVTCARLLQSGEIPRRGGRVTLRLDIGLKKVDVSDPTLDKRVMRFVKKRLVKRLQREK